MELKCQQELLKNSCFKNQIIYRENLGNPPVGHRSHSIILTMTILTLNMCISMVCIIRYVQCAYVLFK